MTDYQKKKLIDLGLVVIGIVLVGLFLKTQLSNPIIIQTDEAATNLVGDYMIGGFSDEEELTLPEYVDLKGTEVIVNQDYIDILITLRGIPKTIPINASQYEWSIAFDVNGDGEINDDVVVSHANIETSSAIEQEASIDTEDVFATRIILMDGETESIVGTGEAVADGNVLYVRIPNSSKLGIHEETPVKVWVTCKQNQILYEDKMPSPSGN